MNMIVKCLVAIAALLWGPVAANAAFTYDYGNDTLFDSSTGLYWTLGQVPSTTGIPNSPWRVASGAELVQLESNALLGAGASNPSSNDYVFSSFPQAISNFVAFFENDAPGPGASSFVSGYSLQTNGGFVNGNFCPGCGNSGGVMFGGFSFQGGNAWWGVTLLNTAATYSWAQPPGCLFGGNCPSEDPAWLVSSVNPVPVPASAWLMLSALGSVGVFARRRRAAAAPAS